MGSHWFDEKTTFTGNFSGAFESAPVYCSPFKELYCVISWESLNNNLSLDVEFCRHFDYEAKPVWVKDDTIIIDIESQGKEIFKTLRNSGCWVRLKHNDLLVSGTLEASFTLKN